MKLQWRRIFALLAAAAVLVAIATVALTVVMDGPPDYDGKTGEEVTVVVPRGADGKAIADLLADAGVVKSSQAFYELAIKDDRAANIRPATYTLRARMSAEAALEAMLNPKNRVEAAVTVVEGARIGQIVAGIVKNSEITEEELTAVLDNPEALGLPESANGNPEGYLYPATYPIEPGTTAEELLKTMVAQTMAVAEDLDIEARAKKLDLTYEQVITMASILEYEAQYTADYPKVARVLFNRLDTGMALQLDSTVAYVSKRKGDVWTTPAERANPSLYNTYQHAGLPPGPIGSPGEKTIEAVLNPADGPWLYFFADKKGKAVFNTDLGKHTTDCQKIYGEGSCTG